MNKLEAWSAIAAEAVPFCSQLDKDISLTKKIIHHHDNITSEKILRAFNSRAFRREQPSDQQLILRIISKAIATDMPIQFVLYWGKGPRCAIAAPDIECLNFLASFAGRVGDNFAPGAAIKLIFTDTHAALNGHAPAGIRRYFDDIGEYAGRCGFDSCWLGDLTRAVKDAVGPTDGQWSQELEARLVASAKKWYRGDETVEDGARKYYQLNMLEMRAVEIAFPDSIFITYNSPDFRDLCPRQLPVFYMYTLRRGYRVKPWFLPSPSEFGDLSSRKIDGF